TIMDLSKERVITAFVDGDRGGELILRELFQVAEVDFVARAPRAHEVEELTQKQIMKCLRNKIPGDQFIEMFGLESDSGNGKDKDKSRGDKVERLERFEKSEKADREKTFDKEDREEPAPQPHADREQKSDRDEKEPRAGRHDRRERAEKEPRSEKPEKTDRRDREEPKAERAASRPERQERFERQEKPFAEEKEMEERKPSSRKQLSAAQEKYKGMINELSSSSKARIIDAKGGVLKEVAVKELVNTLKEEKDPISAVVFDGIITQRILDLASDLKIVTIVGTKMGNITKQPAGIDVWSKDDLN
ncbi:MAG: hypothetical protein MIO87_03920, partial [Methanomassiliicoccales archaeon]|nr:hypothetical protein [Methanomassiliicoccales archaeon]